MSFSTGAALALRLPYRKAPSATALMKMTPHGIPAAKPTLTAGERPLEAAVDEGNGAEDFEEVEAREAELAGADGEDRMILDVVTAVGRGKTEVIITGAAVDNAP
jgi:hypothetical protein